MVPYEVKFANHLANASKDMASFKVLNLAMSRGEFSSLRQDESLIVSLLLLRALSSVWYWN